MCSLRNISSVEYSTRRELSVTLSPHYFDIIRSMKTLPASELLAALGHESRLAIFRILVEAGVEGINASAIAEKLKLPAASASFHLAHLNRVGLIKSRQASRFIYYSAEYRVMDGLIAYMTQNCCEGNPCLPKTSLSCGLSKKAPRLKKATTHKAKP